MFQPLISDCARRETAVVVLATDWVVKRMHGGPRITWVTPQEFSLPGAPMTECVGPLMIAAGIFTLAVLVEPTKATLSKRSPNIKAWSLTKAICWTAVALNSMFT